MREILIALLRTAPALPAMLMLITSPVWAASPGVHFVSMCTAEGPQLVLIPGEDPVTPPADRHDRMGMSCGHALCPREILPGKKARSRA